jgi:hypothetical protein
MTAEEFFPLLNIPIYWKRVGRNDVPDSIGVVYDNRKDTIYRVFFNINSELGGIVERKRTEQGRQVYKCLISNKSAEDINVYINANLK